LRIGETFAFLAGFYRTEQAIAERLRELGHGEVPWGPADPEKALA
jgi:hypothetical protein